MRFFKFFLLSIFFIFSIPSFSLSLVVNQQPISTDAYSSAPEIIDNRTYVPLRFVSDALGYQVEWDGANRQVLISDENFPADFVIPENTKKELRIVFNGRPMFFPADYGQPFINSQDTTMVPVRGVSEAMDFIVSFSNNTVYIDRDNPGEAEGIPVNNPTINPDPEKDEYSKELSILGSAIATREQLAAYTNARARSYRLSIPQMYGREYIEVPDLIDLYLEIGSEYGIRGDIAYLQAIKETNFFQFTGLVQPHQNNYAGIWATGTALSGNEPYNGVDPEYISFITGEHGVTFSTPRIGVEAQIQHLYAYATTAPLPEGKELLSPRFIYVNRGCAPRWVDLGGKWAYPGYNKNQYPSLQEAFNAKDTYGHSILEDYLAEVLAY